MPIKKSNLCKDKREWHISEDIKGRFSTEIHLEKIDGLFRISFFERRPNPNVRKITEAKKVQVECFSIVTISAKQAKALSESILEIK